MPRGPSPVVGGRECLRSPSPPAIALVPLPGFAPTNSNAPPAAKAQPATTAHNPYGVKPCDMITYANSYKVKDLGFAGGLLL